MAAEPVRHDLSPLRDADLHLFNEGTHHRLYERLGAQIVRGGERGMAAPGDGEGRGQEGRQGDREPVITHFAVWAPNAREVSVVGDFNDWRAGAHTLRARGGSGIWEGAVAGVGPGERYKYHVVSHTGDVEEKADPYAFATEEPPRTASVVWQPQHDWGDADWMERRGRLQAHDAPLSIYEVHLGSWRRPADGDGFLGYRELAHRLAEYVVDAGFTHVELMPVTEHPFYGSWGYQCTGYFAPTARHGRPDDFMYLVDVLHRHDIGVILDWVPSHFPTDAHGLGYFDGTHLYEHADPRLGMHPDWKSFIFNYGRHEVRSFLLSSALFWLDRYHVDGLRLDAVASMLYRDYSRQAGEWLPNRYGGRESLEAIDFLRQLNETVYERFPDVQTFAEESTAWPAVSRPTWTGGLGFGFKWDMGWMHDTLKYLAEDPVHRKYHHENLTFRMIYAWNENFVLPLSHDEVVHGKRSLAAKMPGDEWRKLANLRLLLGYMYAQPGKKLLFMGGEFGQWREWDHDDSLDWHLLDDPAHAGVRRWVQDLNRAYREIPALHQVDTEAQGFEWIDTHDARHSVLCFLRRDRDGNPVLVACNFTPVPRHEYRVGAPVEGRWEEILNSDAEAYGGSGQGNLGGKVTDRSGAHGRPCSLALTLPPLGMVMLAPRGE